MIKMNGRKGPVWVVAGRCIFGLTTLVSLAVPVAAAQQRAKEVSPGTLESGPLPTAISVGDETVAPVLEMAAVLGPADMPFVEPLDVQASLASNQLDVTQYTVPTDTESLIHFLGSGYLASATELTLDEAIALALEYNHGLNQRRLDAQAACVGVEIDWTIMRPQLSMQAKTFWRDSNLSSSEFEIPNPEGGDPIVFDITNSSGPDLQSTLAFNLTQRIYDFGLTHHKLNVAKAQHAIKNYTVDMAEQQLVHDLTETHINFSLALGQAKIRQDEVSLAKEFLRQTQIQFDVGTVPKLDVIRAESRLQIAQENCIKALAQVGDVSALFFSMLGAEDKRYIPTMVTASLLDATFNLPGIQEAVDFALASRPELELQYATLFAGESEISLARNRPILEGYANAFYLADSSSFQGTDNYEYGVQLNFPLFTGGKDKYERKQAQLELAALSQGVLDLEAKVELDATIAWNRCVSSLSTVVSAKKNLALSGEALRAASVGYKAGVTTYIEFEDAFDQNVAAALTYLFSLAEVKKAEINLHRAMGFPHGYPGDPRAEIPVMGSMLELLGDHSAASIE